MEIERIVMQPGDENCYLVREGDRAFVVDPGGEPEAVLDLAARRGAKIEWVLLTHAHYDHILGAERTIRAGAKLALLEVEAPALASPVLSLCAFVGYPQPRLAADLLLRDGDKIDFAGIPVTVVATPGHTAGSCAFVTEKGVFTGDTVFRGTYGRTDFPTGDAAALRASVEKLCALPDETVFYPGHYEPTTARRERETNPVFGEEL